MTETYWGQGEVGEGEEQQQKQLWVVVGAERKHQARGDMVGQVVQEVAYLFGVMMWGEPGPLVEVGEQEELKRCDGAPMGQEVLELLVMSSLDFLKLYNRTQSLPYLLILEISLHSVDIYENHAVGVYNHELFLRI
jgi:hypothetical protein